MRNPRNELHPPIPVPWWYAVFSMIAVAATLAVIPMEEVSFRGLIAYHPALWAVCGVLAAGGIVLVEWDRRTRRAED